VAVSSTETNVSIHFLETMSRIAKQTRRDRGKCVASQIQILLGAHTNHSGHGFFTERDRGRGAGSESPWSISTRRTDDGDTLRSVVAFDDGVEARGDLLGEESPRPVVER
jgi:hypothetical protein